MFLPDINVWVALTFPNHKHHGTAKTWFDGQPADRIRYFCRNSQMGFMRLVNNKQLFPAEALTQDEAWQQYDRFRADPRTGFALEPAGLDSQWRKFSNSRWYSPNALNDAYLAAFAIAGGYELVTFDTGFRQFPGLRCTILPVSPPAVP